MGERTRGVATLGLGLLLVAVALGCGGSSERSADDRSNRGGMGGAAGGGGDGVRVPDVPIDITGGNTNDVDVDSSTLGRDADGQIRLLLTFENRGPSAICAQTLTGRLLDGSSAALAGSEGGLSPSSGLGFPGFNGEMFGHSHRLRRSDGVVFVETCVSPGQRGGAFLEVWSQEAFFLPETEVTRILDATARIELWFPPGSEQSESAEPAPDLLVLEEAALADAEGGKVLRGSITTGEALSYYRVRAMLFDGAGRIVDLASFNGSSLGAGSQDFETPPADLAAVRFEPFLMAGFL